MDTLLERFAIHFSIAMIRYVLFSGVLYLLFYVWKKRDWFHLKIQQKFPEKKRIIDEVKYSTLSIFIFALVGVFMFELTRQGYTKIYSNFYDYSIAYFIFSTVLFIIAHDTYFYWAHRFMHWDKIYKYVHRVHHLSTNPSPWAAFSFHPLEAILEVGILPIMLFLIPVHTYAILIWILYMTILNVMGHLGYEIFPSGFTTNNITKWHNSSVHHNMHHRYVKCNYGLYFNFWDRLLGTNHAKYDEEFEQVQIQKQNHNIAKTINEV